MDDEEPIPPDGELRKRLFNSPVEHESSKEEANQFKGRKKERKRDKEEKKTKRKKQSFGLGGFGVLLFLILCALSLAITLQFNQQWREITWEQAKKG